MCASSRVNVLATEIHTSVTIDTLLALLSQIRSHELYFVRGGRVLDMFLYTPPPPKVSLHQHIYLIFKTYKIIFPLIPY